MKDGAYETIDEYLATQQEPIRGRLAAVRAAIRAALPEAEEGISYRIPVFRLHGKPVLYCAGFEKHYSVYPVNAQFLESMGVDPSAYNVNDKGTMRFAPDQAPPVELIARIAQRKAEMLPPPKKKVAKAKLAASGEASG